MRILKLQVQMTINGFVGRPNGDLDWVEWNWTDDIKNYVNDLHNSVDTILMGRKMTDGFISAWKERVADPNNNEYPFAKKMLDIPKVVFTKTLKKSDWPNTALATGDLTKEVNNLKSRNGNDMIVYGGAGFVSSLVQNNLIDEYYLFVNPSVIDKGLTIFDKVDNLSRLDLIQSRKFDCGIVLNIYKRK
jgi:dihydrofolate reductase